MCQGVGEIIRVEPVCAALGHEPFFVGAQFLHVVLGAAATLKLDGVEVAVFHALAEQYIRPAHLFNGIEMAHPMRRGQGCLRNASLYFFEGLEHGRRELLFNVLYFLLAQRDHWVQILK